MDTAHVLYEFIEQYYGGVEAGGEKSEKDAQQVIAPALCACACYKDYSYGCGGEAYPIFCRHFFLKDNGADQGYYNWSEVVAQCCSRNRRIIICLEEEYPVYAHRAARGYKEGDFLLYAFEGDFLLCYQQKNAYKRCTENCSPEGDFSRGHFDSRGQRNIIDEQPDSTEGSHGYYEHQTGIKDFFHKDVLCFLVSYYYTPLRRYCQLKVVRSHYFDKYVLNF